MFEHYKELFRLYRGSIAWAAIVAGLISLGLSALLLTVLPNYKSTVTINMQPSEEALRFSREFTGAGQFNPATIITQTHIERLLSDPVAERALDILLAEPDGALTADEPDLFDAFRTVVWEWWARLNYGFFVQPDEHELYLNKLKRSISVDFVEGSYILRLEAKSQYPTLAARIANAYATAYTEIASEDFLDQAFNAADIVQTRIDAKEAELARLLDRREELRDRLGVNDIVREVNVLLTSRQEAMSALQDAQIELQMLQNELEFQKKALGSQAQTESGALELQRQKIEDRQDEVVFRERTLKELDAALDSLGKKERQFAGLTNAIEATEQELTSLRDRLVTYELSSEARMSQVRIVNTAKPAVYPDSPKVLSNTVVATVAGGLLTIVALILMDAAGMRVRTQFDLQALVGTRALPTAFRRVQRLARDGNTAGRSVAGSAFSRFSETLGHRLAANDGLKHGTVLVTGFLEDNERHRVAKLLELVIEERFGKSGTGAGIDVQVLPPPSAIAEWDDLPMGSIVAAVPPGRIGQSDLEEIRKAGEARHRPVFMLIWS